MSENATKTYKLQVRSFTGLQIVYINTEEKKPIESKEEYVKGTIRVVSNNVNGIPDFESSMNIKGRGNTTWGMPKKPYKIKFDSKVSLLGEPEDKEWVLLANYADKTQLRNEMAFFLGEISSLEYTPRTHFVEVVVLAVVALSPALSYPDFVVALFSDLLFYCLCCLDFVVAVVEFVVSFGLKPN